MRDKICVLVVGMIICPGISIATEGEQQSGGSAEIGRDLAKDSQSINAQSGSAVMAVREALDRALWEIETKRMAIENERQRLDALIAKVEKIDGSVKESEKGFDKLIDKVSWGSEITTNILEIVLTMFGLLFAGGAYALYQTLLNKATKELQRLISEHDERLAKKSYSLAGAIYWQLSQAFYSYYRLLLGPSDGIEYQNTVKMAVLFTEYALANYEFLPDDTPQKDILLKRAEHAVFYHKASLRDASQARTALDFALTKLPAIIETFRQMNSIDWYYAQETRCWILIRYGDSGQKDMAIREIRDMLGNSNIPAEFREEVREDYAKILIPFA